MRGERRPHLVVDADIRVCLVSRHFHSDGRPLRAYRTKERSPRLACRHGRCNGSATLRERGEVVSLCRRIRACRDWQYCYSGRSPCAHVECRRAIAACEPHFARTVREGRLRGAYACLCVSHGDSLRKLEVALSALWSVDCRCGGMAVAYEDTGRAMPKQLTHSHTRPPCDDEGALCRGDDGWNPLLRRGGRRVLCGDSRIPQERFQGGRRPRRNGAYCLFRSQDNCGVRRGNRLCQDLGGEVLPLVHGNRPFGDGGHSVRALAFRISVGRRVFPRRRTRLRPSW